MRSAAGGVVAGDCQVPQVTPGRWQDQLMCLVPQLRIQTKCGIELGASGLRFAGRLQRQSEIVVSGRVVRFAENGCFECLPGWGEPAGAQTDQAQIVLGFGGLGVTLDNALIHLGSLVQVVQLHEYESELHSGVEVVRLERDGLA